MAPVKRKRNVRNEDSSDESSSISIVEQSDSDIDITRSLAGKKMAVTTGEEDVDDFEELEDVIKQSVLRRDKKEGTKLLKQTKGKTKLSKGEIGGGSFQSMGLHPSLLRSLTLRGYKVPTPIQRLAIPSLLTNPPRDLVGMARTGSGKTLAYMIPLVQRLSGRHASTFGTRALVMVPARELALQVLKVGKELVRGWNSGSGEHAGDNEDSQSSRSESLRWGLVVGGESMDEQFEMIANNPDVIIATPGRLLHLIIEMSLDMRSVQYVVFDEADRLFELGFSTALDEILHRLPSSRQTLLFSATLPKTLVEFAKAGLQDPKLVRLDAESKISSDLRMAFFSVKQAEKDACLLVLLRDIIKVPLGEPETQSEEDKSKDDGKAKDSHQAAPHQALIFVATKHHVEYLNSLLLSAGYSVSHIYGTLDQSARSIQMDRFRRGLANILVVTDVAARGIDIPVLENVVNYDFPTGARVFIHRVGRTARAGRKGWAWSFVSNTELPHLLDLQLFLGRPVKSTAEGNSEQPYVESLILGAFPREKIDDEAEYITSSLDQENRSLSTLREVMRKGQSMYERSQGKASQASYKRAKEMLKSGQWGYSSAISEASVHPVCKLNHLGNSKEDVELARNALLRAVNAFTPAETVFEVGSKSKSASAALMKDRRKALEKARVRSVPYTSVVQQAEDASMEAETGVLELADEDDIEAAFSITENEKKKKKHFRDSEFYMSHFQKDAMTEKGYSLRDGASFAEQANGVSFDLAGDEGRATNSRPFSQLKWDRKKKKFIKGDGVGADNVKLIRTESGARLPATYRSGRFDEWKSKSRVHFPKVGEAEPEGAKSRAMGKNGKRFKHQGTTTAKPLDKLRTDYERKVHQKTKGGNHEAAQDDQSGKAGRPDEKGKKSRYGNKSIKKVKSELKSAAEIRKQRELVERKRAKNARPSRKGKR